MRREGFGFSGWMLGDTARTATADGASKAVIAAVAPICVEQLQRSADAATNIVELKKISSWKQATFVEQGGWGVMPGGTGVQSGVAKACAAMLNELK